MDRQKRLEVLHSTLKSRTLILDGGMGTLIQAHQLEEADYRGDRFADLEQEIKGNNDLLVLTQPDIIKGIHKAYLNAGADIIETNTFGATPVGMAEFDLSELCRELNLAAVQCARQAADEYLSLIHI